MILVFLDHNMDNKFFSAMVLICMIASRSAHCYKPLFYLEIEKRLLKANYSLILPNESIFIFVLADPLEQYIVFQFFLFFKWLTFYSFLPQFRVDSFIRSETCYSDDIISVNTKVLVFVAWTDIPTRERISFSCHS